MGYSSEVALTLHKSDMIDLFSKAKEAGEGIYEFLGCAKLIKHTEEYASLYWDWVKWYDGYTEVDFVTNFYNQLLDDNKDYSFKRIGEDNEDYESTYNGDYEIDEHVEFARRFETDWAAETTIDDLKCA